MTGIFRPPFPVEALSAARRARQPVPSLTGAAPVVVGPGPTAADIPGRFDVIIDGHGYRYLEPVQSAGVWGLHRAVYSFSPTFVERQNVNGDYGDNQQDFWLTWTQRDWSLGQGQKHWRAQDGRDSRFYLGSSLDISIDGEVSNLEATIASSATGPACATGQQYGTTNRVLLALDLRLKAVNDAAAFTDINAHGCGGAPTTICVDDAGVIYMCCPGGGVGIRKVNGTTVTTFSATECLVLEHLSNTLYGLKADGTLERFDTAGTATAQYQWKGDDATTWSTTLPPLMKAFGGKLAILIPDGARHPTLYLFDGTAPFTIGELPRGFIAKEMVVAFGTIFIAGVYIRKNFAQYDEKAAILYYQNGALGTLWQAEDFYTGRSATTYPAVQGPGLAEYRGGLVWFDTYAKDILFYDPVQGGVHTIQHVGTTWDTSNDIIIGSAASHLMVTANHPSSATTVKVFPDITYATVATLQTSLADLDSSLTKYFKGVTIDANIPAGCSVDIAYELDSVTGAYTNVQTGAVSGTEYTINASGTAISIKLTLNSNGTARPTVRRIAVRAVPVLQKFKMREYALDLSGRDGDQMVRLHDDSFMPKDGHQMAQELLVSAASTVPITIIDRFGTFTGVIEPDSFEMVEVRKEEYACRVKVRQV